MIQKLLLVVVMVALISSSFSCGLVKPSVSGTYLCTQGSKDYDKGNILELKKDGTLYVYTPGKSGVSGKWELDGDEIYLIFEFFGLTWKGNIKGDTIFLEEGSIWVKEKEKAATPTAAIPLPSGTTSVGDFTVALSSVEREESITTLYFAITKSSNTGSNIGTATIILTDDHDNKYQGTLDITPEKSPDDFLTLLPQDFIYVRNVRITMPKAAPITRIKLGETEEVAFKEVRLVEPSFKRDFVGVSVQPGASVPLGKYLAFTVGRPEGDLIGWMLPVGITNADYNSESLQIRLGLQFVDGKLIWKDSHAAQGEIPGSGQATLRPRVLTLSEVLEQSDVRAILMYLTGSQTSESWLKVVILTPADFDYMPERFVYDDSRLYASGRVHITTTDGSQDLKLGFGYGHGPSFFPDGTRVVYTDTFGNLHFVNADGANEERVGGYPELHSNPVVAPDGRSIAFRGKYGVHVSELDLSGEFRVVDFSRASLLRASGPSWSPDGEWLAFWVYGGPNYRMYAATIDGSTQIDLGEGSNPVWSPRGDKIAFTHRGGLYVMDANGSNKTKLATGIFINRPAWSPDGTRIAFVRNSAIYAVDISGVEEIRLIDEIKGVTSLGWAPALRLTEKGPVPVGMVQPASTPTPAPAATLEVANLDRSEVTELRGVVEEILTQAELIANEDQKALLTQANTVLDVIGTDSELHNLVAEKTEEERLILDLLKGIFGVGAEHFLNIPSPITWAIADSAEELGNQIAEWQVLGQLSFARVTQPDSGVMEVVYHKELGEVWVDFQIYNPVGRVCMYIPVELLLVSPEGGGNILLSEGVRPVIENCRIAYRFDK